MGARYRLIRGSPKYLDPDLVATEPNERAKVTRSHSGHKSSSHEQSLTPSSSASVTRASSPVSRINHSHGSDTSSSSATSSLVKTYAEFGKPTGKTEYHGRQRAHSDAHGIKSEGKTEAADFSEVEGLNLTKAETGESQEARRKSHSPRICPAFDERKRSQSPRLTIDTDSSAIRLRLRDSSDRTRSPRLSSGPESDRTKSQSPRVTTKEVKEGDPIIVKRSQSARIDPPHRRSSQKPLELQDDKKTPDETSSSGSVRRRGMSTSDRTRAKERKEIPFISMNPLDELVRNEINAIVEKREKQEKEPEEAELENVETDFEAEVRREMEMIMANLKLDLTMEDADEEPLTPEEAAEFASAFRKGTF